jgi:hypothetical protein
MMVADMYLKLIEMIKTNQPFSFARYGDGEVNAMLGKKGRNCDGHNYFPDMGEALRSIVKSEPEYFLGMQGYAMRTMKAEIEAFLGNTKVDWIDADLLHRASIDDRLALLFSALGASSVVLVGPAYLAGLSSLFPIRHHIAVPQKDCWLETEAIVKKIAGVLQENKFSVVLFCASMASNVWIDKLHTSHGQNHCFIDAGSVFDPYVGKDTRGYHKKILARLN